MSDINGLHNTLDSVFPDRMKDIQAANESANRIADEVEKFSSLFEEHETAWHGSIEGIGHQLKQGLGQLSDQLSKSERNFDCIDSIGISDHISDYIDAVERMVGEIGQKLYRYRRLSSTAGQSKDCN